MTEESDETEVLTPAQEPPRRERPRWLTVTAGALGVALLAGGLFGAQAVLGGGEGGRGEWEGTLEPEWSGPGSRTAGEGVADWPGGYWGTELVATGPLPQGPGSATVYGFAQGIDEERVAELAAALGVEGEPRLSDGHWWHAAGPDANGSYLSATRETGQWFYSAESGVDAYTTVEPSDPDDPHTVVSGEGVPAQPVGPAPSREEALAAAAPLLDLLGLTDAPVEELDRHDGNRTLLFPRMVDGLRAHGLETEITVSSQGAIVSASGSVGEPVVEREREMLSAQETLDARNAAEAGPVARVEPGFAGCPTLLPEEMPHIDGDPEGESAGVTVAECKPVPLPEPIELPEPIVEQREVTGAEQVLMLWQENDFTPSTLVPGWSYTLSGGDGFGSTLQYPAVEFDGIPDGSYPDSGSSAGSAEPAYPGDGGTTGGSDGGEEPGYTGTSVESYDPQDTALELTYWTGVCAEYRLVAEESADEVRVLVEEVPGDPYDACILVAEEQTGELTLDSPIGDRTLVDEWGQEIPVS
ncbi:hypothetical protein AB0O69_24160 [Streptomyces xiamenensis]|uniref:hypothetical protein n=1 Tax=Streptomyces xiamenensis TaxID=408015 RepID=UPI0034467377